MAKAPTSKSVIPKKKSESGLIGGPSTFRGVTYEVDLGVYLSLEQISLSLADPFTPRTITMEPRTSTPNVTRWDIQTEPPPKLFEAKFNPKRDELVDWLHLVGRSSVGMQERRFCFVYAEERAAAKLIEKVKALKRIAGETSGTSREFHDKVAYEDIKGPDDVLSLLGENAAQLLRRIDLEQISDGALDSDIRLRLRYLTTPEQASALRKYLFEKLQRAAPTRVVFLVTDIIDELREAGFTLNPPALIDAQALSPNASAALAVLQNCKRGFPGEVLADAIGVTQPRLAAELEPVRVASVENGLWSLAPLSARLARTDEAELRARALQELISFVKRHGKTQVAQEQVTNVIALAEACLDTHPRLVATVFGTLDKLLKEIGKKHLVREVALLSKAAAQHHSTDREMKLAMVRSYICGLVWYYQRVGDMEEANAAASKSWRYAEEVDSKVDLAFSAKCTGRLRRIEAEGMGGKDRQSKLSESIGMLERAIQNFTNAEGYGTDSAEVGDCYSLMARTHLIAGDIIAAREKLERALARIPDDGGKDRIDVLILAGDIAVAAGNNEEALLRYDQAVSRAEAPGREVTEMRARALRQRGRIKRTIANKTGAEADLKEAARIWTELGEPNFAGEAEFEMLDLTLQLPELSRAMLQKEPGAVRAQVIKLHLANVAGYESKDRKVAGRRADPPASYWNDLIRRAHELVGFEVF